MSVKYPLNENIYGCFSRKLVLDGKSLYSFKKGMIILTWLLNFRKLFKNVLKCTFLKKKACP